MAKLPHLTGKELGKIIEKLGFKFSHQTGSHMIYKHPDGRKTTIPYHAREEIGPGFLIKLLKKIYVSPEMSLWDISNSDINSTIEEIEHENSG